MIRRLLSVGGFTALSRVVGFLRDVMLAAVLGAGPLSDAFMVAFRLPNHFRAIFAEGAFNAAFLPRFTAAATKSRKDGTPVNAQAARFADDVFAWQMAAQIVLLIAAVVCMRQIVWVLAPGFADDPAQMALAVDLTRITFPYLLCIAVATQLSAMMNAIGRFKAAAAAPIFLNVAMIGTLLIASHFPTVAHAAAYGVLIAGFLQLLFIVWSAARSGLRLHLRVPKLTPDVRGFFGALGAATIGASSVQIGLFMDTLIASFLPPGDLTALYYADRINQLPMGIIGVALGTVLLPEMSARLAKGDERGASVSQNRAIALGLLLTLPCVAAFFTIPETLMRAMFARGAFNVAAADTSAVALVAYGIGLPGFVLVRCVIGSFYARQDTATPVRATVLSVIANILFKVVAVWGLHAGVVGIALGTSFGAWVNLLVLTFLARRRGVLVATTESWRAAAPIVVAALAAAAGFSGGKVLGAMFAPAGTRLHDEVAFLVAAALGGAAYALVVSLARKRLPLFEPRAPTT